MGPLETAYRRYGLQIYRRCVRILRDEAEAEDVTHDVFLRAMDRLPPAPEEAMAWLYRVSTNACLNRLRDRGMRERRPWQDALREAAHTRTASPEGEALRRDLTLHLLDGLDPETQAIALYYHVDGMTQSEIALVVGMARGTVNRKLREFAERASARVAEALG
jgi:RNA polymerase sigma-70 factor (ECF subfamily)